MMPSLSEIGSTSFPADCDDFATGLLLAPARFPSAR